ncbi:MAG: riboflavin synthase [Kiritimatiellae bacterium]|nr:riboflavin synthase [Kiritimatiellia bacterium]
MFTGLIQRVGIVRAVKTHDNGAVFIFSAPGLATSEDPLRLGESIAVNGACLTVARIHDADVFEADVLNETLRCTIFSTLKVGDAVNLERALRFGDRLAGHLVSGHIDGIGTLLSVRQDGRDKYFRFGCSPDFARGVVRKGSVAINGTSLTVCAVGDDWFEVALIPTTLRETMLGQLTLGAPVNLESDIIGAYVRRAMGADSTLSLRQIIAAGFAD